MTTCRCIFRKSLQNRIPDFLSISISFTQFGIVGRVPLLLHAVSYQFRAVFPFEIELCHDRPTGVRNCCYCCHITTGAIVKTIHVTCPLRSVSVWLHCSFSFSCILYLSPIHFILSLSLHTCDSIFVSFFCCATLWVIFAESSSWRYLPTAWLLAQKPSINLINLAPVFNMFSFHSFSDESTFP